LLLLLFVGSRLFYYHSGVVFNDSTLTYFWQYLDVELLKSKLLESCFYLHGQPPLFNLFLGTVLKLSATHSKLLFQFIYSIAGFVIYYCIYKVSINLGVSRLFAIVFSTLFIISPDAVLYENWLFYTYPVTSLLILSALLLFKYSSSGNRLSGFLFFVTIALVCITRSSFHLIFYILTVITIIALDKNRRKTTALLSAAPFMAVLVLYIKNLIIFGFFGLASWAGMNFWVITSNHILPREIQKDISSGELSPIVSKMPFSPLDKYPAKASSNSRFINIESLSKPYKSNNMLNLHNYAYIDISNEYMENIPYVLKKYPNKYLKGVFLSWVIYFQPARNNNFLARNSKSIPSMIMVYDYILRPLINLEPLYFKIFEKTEEQKEFQIYGRSIYLNNPVRHIFLPELRLQVPLLSLLFLPFLVISGTALILRHKKEGSTLSLPDRTVLGYICLTIFYTAFVGNLFELGENNRFRFPTDPLYLILFLVIFQRIAHGLISLSNKYKKKHDH
jgi:hypothetical protein